MNTRVLILLAACLTSFFSGGAMAVDDLRTAIASLQQSGGADRSGELVNAVEVVRLEMPRGDMRSWSQLKDVLDDPAAPAWVRMQLAGVLLEKLDPAIAADAVGMMDSWSKQLTVSTSVDGTKQSLLGDFVERVDTPPFRDVLADPATLRMLSRVYLESHCSIETKRAALKAIEASPASPDERRRIAEDIMSRQPRQTQVAPELLRMMGPSSFPTLRAMVRQSSDADSFAFAAAAALANFGDDEILPDLLSIRSAFRKRSRSATAYLDLYVWEIQVQHPVASLLDYIKSSQDVGAPQKRVWAMERARDLGISAEDIRKAILAHASKVRSTERIDPRSGRIFTVRPGLATIKVTANRLGILRSDDLPDVGTLEVTPDK